MTDKTISDYPSASTLQDADELLVVQNGDYKKASGAVVKSGVAPSQATQTEAGILEIASTTEAQSRTEDSKAMTSRAVQDWADGGIVLDGATDGDMGDGSINAKALYVNGEAVAGGGGMELIATATPTGVNEVRFENIPQTYSALYLAFENISMDTTSYLNVFAYGSVDATLNPVFGEGFARDAPSMNTTSVNHRTQRQQNLLGVTTVYSTSPSSQAFSGHVLITGYTHFEDDGILGVGNKRFESCITNNNQTENMMFEGYIRANSATDNPIQSLVFRPQGAVHEFDGGSVTLYGIK